MTIPTPQGPLVLADSIRDLSAARYLLFNQAWARENGLGTDLYDADSHLVRLGLFLSKNDIGLARAEYNNLVLQLENLAGADPAHPERPATQHLQAAVLAPLVVSMAGVACPDASEAGLKATTAAILASGLTQQQLADAVADSKKNFKRIF